MAYVFAALIGYFLGCSNMAYYLAKLKGVDLNTGGSGNPGASNATILMGWKVGVTVGIHDIGKAILAVILVKLIFPDTYSIAETAGVACIMGHIFPVFLRFKGGKGFASYIGMMVALNWKAAIVILIGVVLITLITDYIVCGTTWTIVGLPAYMAFSNHAWIPALIVCISTAVILYKHRHNYVRIFNRTEIGLRSTIRGEHRVK